MRKRVGPSSRSSSMRKPSESLLINSSAFCLPPRWAEKSANVSASKTDDFPLPFGPESIQTGRVAEDDLLRVAEAEEALEEQASEDHGGSRW